MTENHSHKTYFFYPSEILVIIYIFITGLLILFFNTDLNNYLNHLLVRVSILIVLALFFFKRINNSKLISQFRPFVPLIFLAYFYNETDYLNNLFFKNDLDWWIARLESFTVGSQPSLSFSQTVHYNWFAECMYFGYFSYYLMIIGVPLYIYFFKSKKSGVRVLSLIIGSFLIYYSLFIIFPVAGPQFYFHDILNPLPQGYLFGNAIRLIQSLGEAPTAAFPSSHVSVCSIILWLCYVYDKKILLVTVPIAILLFFSTVYLRAHYFVDVIAGIVFTPIVYKISSMLCNQLNNTYFSFFSIKTKS